MDRYHILFISTVFLSASILHAEEPISYDITEAGKPISENLLKIIHDSGSSVVPEPKEYQPKTVITSEDIGRGIDNTIYFSSPNSPIRIKKIFSPANKTNYLLGDPIGVYVEISSINEDLVDLSVLEVIDNDLHVINISNDYGRISNLNDICEYRKELNRDFFLESENCINKNSKGFRKCPVNRTGVTRVPMKNETEYVLFSINSSGASSSEIDNIYRVLDKDFDIFWAKNGSSNYITTNNNSTILINRIKDIDFVELNIDKINSNAKLNINNDRDYEFKARQDGKSVKINDTEVDLRFNLTNLLKRETFVYKYYIKPKKSGTFNTVTVVRSWGRSDAESTASLDVKDPNPIFDIIPRPKELKKWKGQPLEIVYDITYLGGSSEPELNNTKLSLENDTNYCISYFDSNKSYKILKFVKYKTEHARANITFTDEGINPIPGIYINDKLYTFRDAKIVITSLGSDMRSAIEFYNIMFSLLGILFSIFAFVILVLLNKKPEEFIRDKLELICRTPIDPVKQGDQEEKLK